MNDPGMLGVNTDETPVFARDECEVVRISADGSVSFNWPVIRETAEQWRPGNQDWSINLAKILSALDPEAQHG